MYKKKLKYHIYINIQTLYSVNCSSTFGSDYSLKSSWVWRYKLSTPVFGEFLPFLSGWMGSIAAQLFSGLSRDVWSGSSPGSGWATQGNSETCPEATPALSWLCVYGRCPVGRWTFAPVWCPEHSGAGFHQGSLCTLLHSSFPWLVSQSLPLKNIPTACCHHHASL